VVLEWDKAFRLLELDKSQVVLELGKAFPLLESGKSQVVLELGKLKHSKHI